MLGVKFVAPAVATLVSVPVATVPSSAPPGPELVTRVFVLVVAPLSPLNAAPTDAEPTPRTCPNTSAKLVKCIGSRSREKAEAAAGRIAPGNGAPPVRGMTNALAAGAGDIVVIAVPFTSHDATLAEIKNAVPGKIVVDAVVPLVPPRVSVVQLPPQGSAARIAQAALGDGVRVVSAFHNVGAAKLAAGGHSGWGLLFWLVLDHVNSGKRTRRLIDPVALLEMSEGEAPAETANS